jgi:hypothetical protein
MASGATGRGITTNSASLPLAGSQEGSRIDADESHHSSAASAELVSVTAAMIEAIRILMVMISIPIVYAHALDLIVDQAAARITNLKKGDGLAVFHRHLNRTLEHVRSATAC